VILPPLVFPAASFLVEAIFRCFPYKPFQPSLLFGNKEQALHSRVCSWSWLQTLDYTRMACQGETRSIKSFITLSQDHSHHHVPRQQRRLLLHRRQNRPQELGPQTVHRRLLSGAIWQAQALHLSILLVSQPLIHIQI
jgi:hypothetical protein